MLSSAFQALTESRTEPQTGRARLQPCRTAPLAEAALAAEVSPGLPGAMPSPRYSPCRVLSSLVSRLSSLPLPKRLAQIALLVVTSLTMLGAGTPSTRFDKLGHKLMCTCGCAEILIECNHMGCPDSPGLIADLHAQLDAGASDSNILANFAQKYGPTVLAAPIRGGFDLVAWIIPFAVLALGALGIIWLLRHWQDRHRHATALAIPAANPTPSATHLRDRIRRETTYEP